MYTIIRGNNNNIMVKTYHSTLQAVTQQQDSNDRSKVYTVTRDSNNNQSTRFSTGV